MTAPPAGLLLARRCAATAGALGPLLGEVEQALGTLEAMGASADTVHDLRLVIEEACVNVVRHAYRDAPAPGHLDLTLAQVPLHGQAALRITLRDAGLPFNPLAQAAPALDTDALERPIGGLGVHLMRSLTDSQHYQHDPVQGNCLVLYKRLAD